MDDDWGYYCGTPQPSLADMIEDAIIEAEDNEILGLIGEEELELQDHQAWQELLESLTQPSKQDL